MFRSFLLGAIFALISPEVRAQQTDADFGAYCRSAFSNSAYQRFDQSWGTEHACIQNGTRQGIDLARACELTTGDRNFEISGTRVLCGGVPGDKPAEDIADLGSPDLSQYCSDLFPNSSYERRAEPTGYEHYCRRPGEYGYMLQPINLPLACDRDFGSENYRRPGVQVICTMQDADAGPTPANLPNNGTPPSQVEPLDPDQPTKIDPPEPNVPLPFPIPNTQSPTTNPDNDPAVAVNLSASCQALGGQWQSGTVGMTENIVLKSDQVIGERVASCDQLQSGQESCRRQARVEQSVQAYFGITMIFQCHLAYIVSNEDSSDGERKAAVAEACAIEPTLTTLTEQVNEAGGQLPPGLHFVHMGQSQFQKMCECAGSEPELTDFATVVEELRHEANEALLREFIQ